MYHCHTNKSNPTAGTGADSLADHKDYVKKAQELGMTALCISEHGNVLNWIEKKQDVEGAGLKYIHANEIYLTKNIRYKRDYIAAKAIKHYNLDKKCNVYFQGEIITTLDEPNYVLPLNWEKELMSDDELLRANLELERDNYHFMTIAKNYEGVLELNEITSRSFIEKDGHSYFNPRWTFDDLKGTSDNILMTSACLASPIWRMHKIVQGHTNKGDAYRRWVSQEFDELMQFFIDNKHRMFFEIQYHTHPEQVEFNKMLLGLSKELGIPLIAGTDTHSLDEKQAKAREIFLKAKGASYGDEDSFDLTMKSYDELVGMFEKQDAIPRIEYLEAIDNTLVLQDMVEEFKLDKSPKYPRIYENSEELFREKINAGFINRGFDKLEPEKKKVYLNRIRDEYATYEKLDAIDYMLLQSQIIDWCKERGIKHGYGRGSVTGSLIAYVLGITEMDSVKHELNFFRFLNPDRVSLADIDIDFPSSRRQEVIDYVSSIEGIDFAEIITLNTLADKGAMKEVARALKIDKGIVEIISKAYDDGTIGKWQNDPEYEELFYYTEQLKGVTVSLGSHPSGVVVSPIDLNTNLSTVYTKKSKYKVTAVNMGELDNNNYVKLDILGLMNIELVNEACELAGITRLTPDNMDVTDEEVWKSMRESTLGVFQMESDSAHALLKNLFSEESVARIRESTGQVNYIALLSMANGAIRPSGKSYRDKFAQGITNENGHEALNEFLKDNLGYLIYQEDIMNFLTKFCNHSGSESDTVRRVLAKKKKKEVDAVLPKIHDGFIGKMVNEYGDTEEHAEEILEQFMTIINDASDYGFSKNHSDPYSYTGYATTYLRHYYPLEFLTTILNLTDDEPDKVAKVMEYIKKKDIKIAPPVFGKSVSLYRLDKEEGQIYKGLKSIKFLNAQVSEELFKISHDRCYLDFVELLRTITEETSADTRMVKILIRLDFFQEFGKNKYLYEIYEKFCERFKKTHKDKTKIARLAEIREFAETVDPHGEYTINETVMYEKDMLNYTQYTDPEFHKSHAILVEINTKYAPHGTFHIPHTGQTIQLKISKTLYKNKDTGEISIKVGDHIRIKEIESKPKNKNIGGKWVFTGEFQNWLNNWELLNRLPEPEKKEKKEKSK